MYKFDEKKHIHTFNDKPLYGITTILGVIAKPALIQWSANEAIKYIKENFKGELTNELLDEAKTAHRRKRDKAGDFGTDIHKQIEDIILKAIQDNGGFVEAESDNQSIKHFIEWAKGRKFLETEKNLYSEKHWIGGIVDMIFERDGKVFIGDIKTSSNIYPEHFLQMAGYEVMLEEMGYKIDGYEVVNLSKDGKIKTARSYGMDRNKKAFLSALELFKSLEALKSENNK